MTVRFMVPMRPLISPPDNSRLRPCNSLHKRWKRSTMPAWGSQSRVSDVSSVLIGDVWHEVAGWSFCRVPFAFRWPDMQVSDRGVDGFTFKANIPATERWVSGPMTAIQAVKHRRDEPNS